MLKNNDYTIGNLLDYLYHQRYYTLIGIDLSRQTHTDIPQHINLIGRLKEDNGELYFLLLETSKKLS